MYAMYVYLAQAVLDFFPDAVSQYGLLGCAAFTILIVDAVYFPYLLIANALRNHRDNGNG